MAEYCYLFLLNGRFVVLDDADAVDADDDADDVDDGDDVGDVDASLWPSQMKMKIIAMICWIYYCYYYSQTTTTKMKTTTATRSLLACSKALTWPNLIIDNNIIFLNKYSQFLWSNNLKKNEKKNSELEPPLRFFFDNTNLSNCFDFFLCVFFYFI